MELKDRVKAARTQAEMTQAELAKEVNRLTRKEGSGVDKERFSQVQVSDLERGKVNRSAYVPHIAVATGVSAAWLAFGLEPMKASYDYEIERKPESIDLSQDELKLLRSLLKKIN